MILTNTYQDIYNDLYTRALLNRAMPYILAIIGIVAIVWALCSIERRLKELTEITQTQNNLLAGLINQQSSNLKEINEKVERQNTILAAQLKMQYANHKGYNTSDPHTNQEPSE